MIQQALGGYVITGVMIVQSLVLVPMYIHFIGLKLYGLWLATGGILAMLGVMDMGMGNLLVQRVAQAYGQQDFRKAGEYFVNGLAVYFLLASALVGVGMLFSYNLTKVLKEIGGDEALIRQCFQLAVMVMGLSFINECLRGFTQALLRPLYTSLALAGARIVGLVTTLIMLYRELGLWAIPVGMLVAEGIALLLNLAQSVPLFRSLGARVALNWVQIKEYMQIGGLLFASRLGHALSRDADPLLITLFMRAEVTAVYIVTRKAADVVFQLLSVILASANGSFSHLAGTGDVGRIGIVAAQLLTLVFFVGLVGFSSYAALNTGFVTLWVGSDFGLDQGVIVLIAAAYLINGLRNMVLTMLNAIGEFNYSSRLVLIEGLIKTSLTALFLMWLGISGVPLALAIVCAVMLAIMGKKLHERISLPSMHGFYIKAAATSAMLLGLASLASSHLVSGSWWQFALYSVTCASLVILITACFNWRVLKSLINVGAE